MDDFFAPADTKTDPIEITKAASERLQQIIEEQKDNNTYLRIGVKGGGCSGLSYTLDFDEKKEYDEDYVVNDVPFILDKRHRMYLEGTRLTFSTGLDNRGFEFENPNASDTCGCGSSFSV